MTETRAGRARPMGGVGPAQMAGRLRGRGRRLAQLAWAALVGTALTTFLIAVPVGYQRFSVPCAGSRCLQEQMAPEAAQALAAAGLPAWFYPVYNVALASALVAVSTAVAVVIAWRRSDEPVALYVSATLVLLSIFINTFSDVLATLGLGWELLLDVQRSLMWVMFPVLLYIFPDGRFVPRWTVWLAPLWVYFQAAYFAALFAVFLAAFYPGLAPASEFLVSINVGDLPAAVQLPLFSVALLSCAYAPLYRYRRVSGPVERQQTKWVVFGLLSAVTLILLVSVLVDYFSPELLVSGTFSDILIDFTAFAALLLVPLTFGVAILRYRLWDIDVLIRRTLSYALLTAGLAGAYFGSVLVLQAAFAALTRSQQPALVTVLSTLAIAALFTPLRRWAQGFIDRRFYRRKYDAARTLAGFGAALRDEVDLAQLEQRLLDVVEDTMQPSQVWLWLRRGHEPQA